MSTPEGKVKDKIKKLLKAHNVWYYMPVSMGMGQHGIPDFLCCISGHLVGIEAKAGTNKPTGLQEMQLARMHGAGATVFVINEDNTELLQTWLLKHGHKTWT